MIPALAPLSSWGARILWWCFVGATFAWMTLFTAGVWVTAPTWLTLALTVCGLVVAIAGFLAQAPSPLRVCLAGSLFLLTAAGLISGIALGEQLPRLAIAVACALLAVLASDAAGSPEFWRRSAMGVLTAIVLSGLALGLWSTVTGDKLGFYSGPLSERGLLGIRPIRGITGHYNSFGFLAALALAVQLRSVLARRGAWRSIDGGTRARWAALLVLGPLASLAALAWSQSRGALLAGLFGVAAALIPWRVRSGRTLLVVWFLGLAAVQPLPRLVSSLTGYTFHGREFPWTWAVTTWRLSRLWGAGPDAFTERQWNILRTSFPKPGWEPDHAHSALFGTISTAGTVGLVFLIATAVLMAVVAIRARRVDNLWAVVTLTTLAVQGTIEPVLGVNAAVGSYLPLLCVTAIIAGSLGLLDRKERGSPTGSEPAAPDPVVG